MPNFFRIDAAIFVRGLLMGGADAVPGVSGGTIALIVGIYPRLVTAISRFDGHLVGLIRRRRWREAARWIDLRFLTALGAGIAVALVTLASVMSYLLLEHRSETLAAFFGLILASTWVVVRMIRPAGGGESAVCLAAGAAGAAFAYWLVGLESVRAADNLGYYFLCGMIAICAMILPGISGAFVLLILGAYETVAMIVKDTVHFAASSADVTKLVVFAAGCGVGLIGFSKLVRWLLVNAHNVTMSVLCGFMLGSLRRIWPFQLDLTPDESKLSHKRYENIAPDGWTGEALACLAIAVAALLLVLAIERWGRAVGELGNEGMKEL